jgi:hypothetical protein
MERSKTLVDRSPKVDKQQLLPTLSDEQIVTERKFPRRSFLTVTGALAGGAMALVVTGCGQDPDKAKSQAPAQEPNKAKSQAPTQDPDAAKTK